MLVAQSLNDHTCQKNSQGRFRHDTDITTLGHAQDQGGVFYGLLKGWKREEREFWQGLSSLLKAQMSTMFNTYHWDSPEEWIVPFRVLYSPDELNSSTWIEMDFYTAGQDSNTVINHLRGFALLSIGSRLFLAPIADLLDGSGPTASIVGGRDVKSRASEKTKSQASGCLHIACVLPVNQRTHEWLAKYELSQNAEDDILQQLRRALITLSPSLVQTWGTEVDLRIRPSPIVTQSSTTAIDNPKSIIHPTYQIPCPACARLYGTPSGMHYHIKSCHSELYESWAHVCVCGTRFSEQGGLARHRAYTEKCRNGSQRTTFGCVVDTCEWIYTTSATGGSAKAMFARQSRAHVKAEHEELYQSWPACEYCGEHFPSKTSVALHARDHKKK
ncbi:hypothetical protein KCU78_g1280, partial [Aureobasidium melanogenum]